MNFHLSIRVILPNEHLNAIDFSGIKCGNDRIYITMDNAIRKISMILCSTALMVISPMTLGPYLRAFIAYLQGNYSRDSWIVLYDMIV